MASADVEPITVTQNVEDFSKSSDGKTFSPEHENGSHEKDNADNQVKKRRPIRFEAEDSNKSTSQLGSKLSFRHNDSIRHHRNKKTKQRRKSHDAFALLAYLYKNKQTLTYVAVAVGMAVSLYPFLKYHIGGSSPSKSRDEKSAAKSRRMGPENKPSPATDIPPDMLRGAHHHMHPPTRGSEGKGGKADSSRRGGSSRGGFGIGSLFGGGMGSLYSAGAVMFAIYSFAKVFMRRGKNKKMDEDDEDENGHRSKKRRGRKRRADSDEEKDSQEEEHNGSGEKKRESDSENLSASSADEEENCGTGTDEEILDQKREEGNSIATQDVRKRKSAKKAENHVSSPSAAKATTNEAEELRQLLAIAQQRLAHLEQQQDQSTKHEKVT